MPKPGPVVAKAPPPPATSALAARTRATVSTASRRIWRDKLVSLGADTAALSDDIGNPPPSLSAHGRRDGGGGSLAAVAPIPVKMWSLCIRALSLVNASSDCQTTLNALSPQNVVSAVGVCGGVGWPLSTDPLFLASRLFPFYFLQWIMKPAGKSRGRGIQVENTLAGILNVRGVDEEGERNSHWIVQKYIERPLIVQGRKWDIRQWVLVTSWNPLTIWIYDRCYLRFCSVPFTLDNLSNRFVHL
jgi:hypothetical protein